ncbi:MAG TPA: beta galactosidase jelly roll domain-containing protein, partial [Gemmatimonadaceae bacterium]|nr:beta galactosidase jelly roll domain-containing protein [Gemmatimonadaceae bacterium]
MSLWSILLFIALVAMPATAQEYTYTPIAGTHGLIPISLDSGWMYLERDAREPAGVDSVPAAAWERVTLPHTWNRYDATDATPGYRRGASWYRRTLDVSAFPAGMRFVLAFEGANTVAEVWVNGRRAGGHVGGYVGFELDVTPLVRRDGPNDVLVRVDNTDDPELIPSHRSDFTIYGGLTRDVWL